MKPPDTSAADAAALFGSRNLPIHLARGAPAAMRGCPMCWTIGQIETLRQHRVRRR